MPFTANRLVLAVPADSAIRSLAGAGDARREGGDRREGRADRRLHARGARRLGPRGAAILRNVRSEEPDVKSIVGKLTQSGADAGFVYVTDVNATKGALRAIELPAAAQPRVVYAAAVVKGTKHPERGAPIRRRPALRRRGARALRAAGFEPPPA